MTDYCSLNDVRQYLGLSPGDDELIKRLITSASRSFDKATGYVFGQTADTSRTYYTEYDVEGRVLYFDTPFTAITSIVNGDATTVLSADYILQPRDIPYTQARIKPIGTTTTYWTNGTDYDGVVVTGTIGYPLNDDVRQAVAMWTAFMYGQKDNPLIDITAIEVGAVITSPNRPKYVNDVIMMYKDLRPSG